MMRRTLAPEIELLAKLRRDELDRHALAERLRVTPMTISKKLSDLHSRGLVGPRGDGVWFLTDAGRNFLGSTT